MTDQIEFANVVLLNKTDMVSPAQIARVQGLVETLNPGAKVLRTTYSKVDLREILDTRLFDFEKAATGAGWLQSLRENTLMEITNTKGEKQMVPKPETLEYGIGTFVYSARRPFHPKRLWDLVCEPFCVLQNAMEEEEEEDSEEGEKMDEDKMREEQLEAMRKEKEELDLPSRAAFKRASPVWKGLLRSKGFVWLATRPHVHGEWSQAGVSFRFVMTRLS